METSNELAFRRLELINEYVKLFKQLEAYLTSSRFGISKAKSVFKIEESFENKKRQLKIDAILPYPWHIETSTAKIWSSLAPLLRIVMHNWLEYIHTA